MRIPEQLALTSDFAGSRGTLVPAYRNIKDAGFTHVMHCHGWDMSENYTPHEMTEIASWNRNFGLRTVDIHGSIGNNNELWSSNPASQNRGIGIVRNRIALADKLGTD